MTGLKKKEVEDVTAEKNMDAKPPKTSMWTKWHSLFACAVLGAVGCVAAGTTQGEFGGSVNDSGAVDVANDEDASGEYNGIVDADGNMDAISDADAVLDTQADSDGADCSAPVAISDIQVNVSPFGNEATVTWMTSRSTSCSLLWEHSPVDYDPDVIFESGPNTSHQVVLEDPHKMKPDDNYNFYIQCMETCPGWPLQVFSALTPFQTKKPHLMIILSPTFSNDDGIDSAINTYADAIETEGWVTDTVKLNISTNTYPHIKELLADAKHLNNTTAATLVGLDLAFDYYTDYLCPKLKDWREIDTINPDPTSVQYNDIAISILPATPPFDADAANLVSQTFLKFAQARNATYSGNVLLYYDPALLDYDFDPPDYPELNLLGGLTIKSDATDTDVSALSGESIKTIILAGHGDIHEVYVNPGVIFNSEELSQVNAPLAILHGCHTYCWPSTTHPLSLDFFGNLVLGDGPQRAIVAGVPVIGSVTSDSYNFIHYAFSQLAKGRSLAQAIYGQTFYHWPFGESLLWEVWDVAIYGDITFHY